MALITCPECGKQISDKAPACIHCGCPVEVSQSKIEEIVLYKVKIINDTWVFGKAGTELARLSVTNGRYTGKEDFKVLATGVTKDRAEILLHYLVSHGGEGEVCEDKDSKEINQKMMDYIDIYYNRNAPAMCPYCKSKQVVTGQRGYKITSGFLGSSKTVNRCSSCGHTWEPKKIT